MLDKDRCSHVMHYVAGGGGGLKRILNDTCTFMTADLYAMTPNKQQCHRVTLYVCTSAVPATAQQAAEPKVQ